MKLSIVKANIIDLVTDAVVLPANPQLKMGSGLSEILFKAAGKKELEKECKKIIDENGILETAYAIPTSAYGLHSNYIIHAVVPKWIDGHNDEYELLSSTYLNALQVADMIQCESIAFPLLASGKNGYDLEIALEIAIESIKRFEGKNLKQAILVIHGSHIAAIAKAHGYQYIEIAGSNKEKTADEKEIAEKNLKNVFRFLKDPENREKVIYTFLI